MQVFLTADANKAFLRTSSFAFFWLPRAGQAKGDELCPKMLGALNLC